MNDLKMRRKTIAQIIDRALHSDDPQFYLEQVQELVTSYTKKGKR